MTSILYVSGPDARDLQAKVSQYRRLALRSCVGAMASLAITVSALCDDLRARFERVGIGVTKDATVALMGMAPTSTKDSSTLGVSTTTLRWDTGGETFTIKLLFDRVIEKTSCDRRSEC